MQAMSTSLIFETVQRSTPLFDEIKNLFSEVIQPIYGDQTTALKKIAEASDRKCEVLLDQNDTLKRILGVLVYKLYPTQEFCVHGADNALELKTLFVVNAENNSGKGLGSKLVGRIEDIAKKNKFSTIVVTASESKPEVLTFLKRKQFQQIHVVSNKFSSDEFILMKRV